MAAQFHASHQAEAARVNFKFQIWDFRLERLQFGEQESAEFGGAFGQFQFLNFRDLRQRHRAADGIAEERAGVNRLAARRRPRGVHQVRAANAGRERKAAGERLAETNQIGDNAAVFARKPFSGPAEAGVNFIGNQQRAGLVAQFPERRQKVRRRDVDAAARLHRLDEDRADVFAAENAADARFNFPEG